MALMSRQRPSTSKPVTSIGNAQKKPTDVTRRVSSAARPVLRPLVLVNRLGGTQNEVEQGGTKVLSGARPSLGDTNGSSSTRRTKSKPSTVVQNENIARSARSAAAPKSSGTTSVRHLASQKLPTASGPPSKSHVAAVPSKPLEQSGPPSTKSHRMSMICEPRQTRPFKVSATSHRRAQSLSASKPPVPAATNAARRTSVASLPQMSTNAPPKANVNSKKPGSAARTASFVSLSAAAAAGQPARARVHSVPALPSCITKKTVSARASEPLGKPLRRVASSGQTTASDAVNAKNVTLRKPSERNIIEEVVSRISAGEREDASESEEEILQDTDAKIPKTSDVTPSMSVLPSLPTASTAATTLSMPSPASRVEVTEAPGTITPPSIPPARSFLRSPSVDILNLPPFVLPPLSLTIAKRMEAFTSYSRSRLDLARIAGGDSQNFGPAELLPGGASNGSLGATSMQSFQNFGKPPAEVASTGSPVDKCGSGTPQKNEEQNIPSMPTTPPRVPQTPDKSNSLSFQNLEEGSSPSPSPRTSISTSPSSASAARQCLTPSVITQAQSPGRTPPPATLRLTIPRHLGSKVVGDSSTQMELDFLRAGAKGCSVLERARVFAAGAQGRAVANAALASGGKGRGVSGGQLSLRAMAIVHRLKNGEGKSQCGDISY